MLETNRLAAVVDALTALTLTLAEPKCDIFPNYKTKARTYTICTGTDAIDFNSSRQFCLQQKGDLVTFPNVEEFEFLNLKLNETVGEDFKYMAGFFQTRKTGDMYSPQTEEYFWVTDTENKITRDSKTYWEPFRKLIINEERDKLHVTIQQLGTFLLDASGTWYGFKSVKQSQPYNNLTIGNVVCAKGYTPTFQDWIVVTIVAIAVTVVEIVIAGLLFWKMKRKANNETKTRSKVRQKTRRKFNKARPQP